jgi:hypothetical protein
MGRGVAAQLLKAGTNAVLDHDVVADADHAGNRVRRERERVDVLARH